MATISNVGVGQLGAPAGGIAISGLAPTVTPDLSLLKGAVDQSLSLNATAAEDTANATAQGLTATGDQQEANLYGNAIAVANNNVGLEAIAGQLQGVQIARKASATTGTAAANAAANGYSGNSLSSVLMLQDSVRQGALAQQLNTAQTNINEGGYEEQAAASQVEQQAATTASSTAGVLGSQYSNAAAISTANAANETSALETLLNTDNATNAANGNTLSPEAQANQDLVLSTLKSPLNGPATLPQSSNPSTALPGQLGYGGTALGGSSSSIWTAGQPTWLSSLQAKFSAVK